MPHSDLTITATSGSDSDAKTISGEFLAFIDVPEGQEVDAFMQWMSDQIEAAILNRFKQMAREDARDRLFQWVKDID